MFVNASTKKAYNLLKTKLMGTTFGVEHFENRKFCNDVILPA